MKKNIFFTITFLIVAIIGPSFFAISLRAQTLFSISTNSLSNENIMQLKSQIVSAEIFHLSLTRNNINKEVYVFPFSSVQNTQIIILNEETGSNVAISPMIESLTEFQCAPFFIEELRQAVLGDAGRYLIAEVTTDFLVKSVAAVSVFREEVFIPNYFYGKKENIKEALPKERQITHILKRKPRLISAFPDNPEHQHYIKQLEDEMSYYVYVYQLPDGTLTIYDEHFNPDKERKGGKAGSKTSNNLEFILFGTMNTTQRNATEYALELWSEQLAGTVPVYVDVDFYSLGQGVLGMTFFPPCFLDTETDIYYPSALWNQLVGYNASGMEDITIVMNSDFSFYFGLDGKGSGYDFVTIMIHEVTHGLGFFSTCDPEGDFAYGYPGIYDCMLYQGLDGLCITELPEYERAALIISNNLYAGQPSSNLLEANGGVRVKMYAPATYRPGSTAHHWDSSVSFQTFMKYAYAYPLHTFNNRKIGMLKDMGWKTPEVDPNAIWVTYDNNGGTGTIPQQQFLSGVEKKIKPNTFSRIGYLFSNWNTLQDGTGISYEERELITIYNDLTLYAQWDGKHYTLNFNPNGGTVSPASKQVTYGEPVGELPVPDREDFNFEGWKISTTDITEETIWNYSVDGTATAIWSIIENILEQQQITSLKIFPNPARHIVELRIKNYEWGTNIIEVYNFFGQLVKTIPLAGEVSNETITQKINISDLSPGIYMVKVGTEAARLVIGD